MTDGPYVPRVAGSAARMIGRKLPEHVAAAVVGFITGGLLANPHRAGKPLKRELEGLYAARRGAFRILYEIDDNERRVTVIRVEHRADAYRPR